MSARHDSQEDATRIVLDLRCYDREAVTLAAATLSRQAEFFIEKDGKGTLEVSLQARDAASATQARRLAGAFLNEALNQDLRLGVARRNQDLLRLLTAQALRSAAGDPDRTRLDARTERRLQSEARRLMAGLRATAAPVTQRRGDR